jgi:hypothetical protein
MEKVRYYDTVLHTEVDSESPTTIQSDDASVADFFNPLPKGHRLRIENDLPIIEPIPAPTIDEQALMDKRTLKKQGEDYDLNGTIYKVPFTSEDANGLIQVNTAFTMGIPETTVHFSNGTVMPIVASDFQAFALWFVTKRNSFFL